MFGMFGEQVFYSTNTVVISVTGVREQNTFIVFQRVKLLFFSNFSNVLK